MKRLTCVRSFRGRPADNGQARARYLRVLYGREVRLARMISGLSQAQAGRRAGMSQVQVSRAERGIADISLDARCRLAAACGHELGWRLYPVASIRLRDSGQMALAEAIVAVAHPSWKVHLEVPIGPGDLRAADLLLIGPTEVIHVEIERALVDFQAQLRSAQLKRDAFRARQTRPMRLVIAVSDNRSSRARLAPFGELVIRTMPTSSRSIWRAIKSGEPLGADGILFVRSGPRRG
jgi:transcriptional regulator with XRE-family HTH domain